MKSLNLAVFLVVASAWAWSYPAGTDEAEDAKRRTCSLQLSRKAELTAVHCAEQFVLRNGYTDEAAAFEPQAHVPEGLEVAATPADAQKARHGMLESRAYAVCHGATQGRYAVIFRYRDHGARDSGRAVSMTAGFDHMTVEHQDYLLYSVTKARGCHKQ